MNGENVLGREQLGKGRRWEREAGSCGRWSSEPTEGHRRRACPCPCALTASRELLERVAAWPEQRKLGWGDTRHRRRETTRADASWRACTMCCSRQQERRRSLASESWPSCLLRLGRISCDGSGSFICTIKCLGQSLRVGSGRRQCYRATPPPGVFPRIIPRCTGPAYVSTTRCLEMNRMTHRDKHAAGLAGPTSYMSRIDNITLEIYLCSAADLRNFSTSTWCHKPMS